MIVKAVKMLSVPKISGILCTSQSVMIIWRLSSSEDNEKEKKKTKIGNDTLGLDNTDFYPGKYSVSLIMICLTVV